LSPSSYWKRRSEALHPKLHFGISTRLDQWLDTSALPGYRIEDNPYTVTRWIKAIGKLPD
jgi:hypothetical protein